MMKLHAMETPFNRCSAELKCHHETSDKAISGIEGCAGWTGEGELALGYVLKGDIACVRIPSPRPPRRADRLWQHTCFELFIAEKGQRSYWEFNFSPSGEWAVYAFKSYRDGGPIEDDGLHPKIVVRSAGNSFELEAIVRLDRLQAIKPQMPLRMGLSAVIEENDGTISYWALKHPPGKPDFHHRDSFALELALPDKSA